MGRWLWLLIATYVVTATTGRVQAIEAVASHTVFYAPEKDSYKPYVEVYWQIAPATLRFTEEQKGQFIAKIKTELVFSTDTGIIRTDRFILQTDAASSLQRAMQQNIIELHRYMMPHGNIKMQLTLQDMADARNRIIIADSFKVEVIGNKPKFSIQILDTSYSATTENTFSKNNMQQIPLCANFLDAWRNTLHFYSELYQSDNVSQEQMPLRQRVFISRQAFSAPLFDNMQTDTILPGSIRASLGKFDISGVPSGNYHLNIVLEDKDKLSLATASVFFQRYNSKKDTAPKQTPDADTTFEKLNFLDLSTTFVSKYTLPQVMAILKMIRPISTAIEQDAIDRFADRPDENYMRYFIYNFWKERNDKNPKKAWDDYAAIVKQVNRMFKGEMGQGYETDRGQVYLKYGKPNDVITVTAEAGTLPYEIWIYNVLPAQSLGGLFLFYRPADYVAGYKLLHSNVRGELRNTAWRSVLYTVSGSGSGNLNSRAEQYFPGNK